MEAAPGANTVPLGAIAAGGVYDRLIDAPTPSGDAVRDSGPSKRARDDDDDGEKEKEETSGRSATSDNDLKVLIQPPLATKEAGLSDSRGASGGEPVSSA